MEQVRKQTKIETRHWKALFGLAMIMPLASMLTAALLYEAFDFRYPGELIGSIMTDIGFNELPAWVAIGSLFVGPVFAFCLNAGAFSRIRFETTREKCGCRAAIQGNWMNLAVLFLSLALLLTLITIFILIYTY